MGPHRTPSFRPSRWLSACTGLIGRCRSWNVDRAQPAMELVALAVGQLIDDAKRLQPRLARAGPIVDREADVAEAGQCLHLAAAVAELPIERQRMPVLGGGLPVVAEVMVGEAEAIPRVGLAATIAEAAVQGERPLAVGQRRAPIAELGVAPANVVERPAYPPCDRRPGTAPARSACSSASRWRPATRPRARPSLTVGVAPGR